MNPLQWLPRPGKTMDIPGGTLWCEKWKVNQERENHVTGQVTFCFSAMAETEEERLAFSPNYLPPTPSPTKQVELFTGGTIILGDYEIDALVSSALEKLIAAYQLKLIRDNVGCDLISAAINETTLALRKERKFSVKPQTTK